MNQRMNIAQPKKSIFPQTAGPRSAGPVAPLAYRPQPIPKVLQTKVNAAAWVNTRTESHRKPPVAPPAYRPQQTPLVLQRKVTTPPPRNMPTAATPVCLQHAPKVQPSAPVSTRAAFAPPAIQRKTAAGHSAQCFAAAATKCGSHARFTHAPFARAVSGLIQRAEDPSTDDEAEDVREVMEMIQEAEQEEFLLQAEESATSATTQSGEARRTFNITDGRSLYELVSTVNKENMTSFYVRVHEGRACNIRKIFGQFLLYDASNEAVHYKTVISRLNVGGDDKGMAGKVIQRMAGTLDLSTVTATQLQAIDLLLLLGVCEGIRLGGNVSTFLHTLERIASGVETFNKAFAVTDCAYVPARKSKGTGQEKHLRGLKTKAKRKKGTAHSSAEILREFSRRPMGRVKRPWIVKNRVGNYAHRTLTHREWRRRVKAGIADKQWLLERQRMGFDLPVQGTSAPHMPYIT